MLVELNSLKIAEDKTFADCARHACCERPPLLPRLHPAPTHPPTRARYMFTTILGLCLPPHAGARAEYAKLYARTPVDVGTRDGRNQLLQRADAQLRRWSNLLQRFLRDEDDQVWGAHARGGARIPCAMGRGATDRSPRAACPAVPWRHLARARCRWSCC